MVCVRVGIGKLSLEIEYNADQFDKRCNETLINMLTYVMTQTLYKSSTYNFQRTTTVNCRSVSQLGHSPDVNPLLPFGTFLSCFYTFEYYAQKYQ